MFCLISVLKFRFFTQNNKDVLLFSHQTSSMKHHLTETHKQNFEGDSKYNLTPRWFGTPPVIPSHFLYTGTAP